MAELHLSLRSMRRVFACALVGSLAVAACSSSSPRAAPVTRPKHAAGLGNPDAPLAQFDAAEAERLPQPSATVAAALRSLANGAPPSASEVAAVRHAMDGMDMSSQHGSNNGASKSPALRAELSAAASVATRYRTAADAQADGYHLASRRLPGIGSHWIKWSLVVAPFDAAHPSMLLFDGDGPTAPLVGLSYYVQSTAAPTPFTSGGAVWHRHLGVCIVHGVLVAEAITARSACAGGRGTLLPGRNIWMLHVWVVPGHENRDGIFAPVNRALCTAAAPCTDTPK